ncbi:BacA-like protein [Poriferisphaera corsica]|uniref:BacA-like protein n=1 Tax=Poriferisphaera corsica TaxID=2528020 RepID=A0A517YSV4_9BACT|nr:polymer-forming cytoskeletal protein [Poriferisphaera corsica]QDU33298.1 BacA-like protein [Poriferisphaera corsica]
MSEHTKNKTILGPDCRISGELALDNDAVIMGQFKGTLRVSGTLELTDSAEVAGTIIVGHLRLAGRAEADVIAENGLELLPGAQLIGQVYTSNLNVVEGASFQGDVCIGPKAMEAAGDVLAQSNIPAPAPTAHDYTDDQIIDDTIEEVEASEVKTVPGSVNAILQRRRAKVLSTRG